MKITHASDEQKLIALAKLDGYVDFDDLAWDNESTFPFYMGRIKHAARPLKNWEPIQPYLYSYNAIVSLIQKQPSHIRDLVSTGVDNGDVVLDFIEATPRELCDALLVATGKFKAD